MALVPSLIPLHIRGQPSHRGGFGAAEGCPQGNGRLHRASAHYGPVEVLLCGVNPVGAHWADEPEAVAGCDDCLELVAEDLADDNDY